MNSFCPLYNSSAVDFFVFNFFTPLSAISMAQSQATYHIIEEKTGGTQNRQYDDELSSTYVN